jgi:protein-S-isoprenylcysteine O-methyltransferase Ste14
MLDTNGKRINHLTRMAKMEFAHLLQDAVILLASAVAVLLSTACLRVPPVVALLMTGILVVGQGVLLGLEPRCQAAGAQAVLDVRAHSLAAALPWKVSRTAG